MTRTLLIVLLAFGILIPGAELIAKDDFKSKRWGDAGDDRAGDGLEDEDEHDADEEGDDDEDGEEWGDEDDEGEEDEDFSEEEISPKDVPSAVKSRVIKTFKRVRVEEAMKVTEDGETIYVLLLESKDQEMEVGLTEDGAFKFWERSIRSNELPKAVRAAYTEDYGKKKGRIEETQHFREWTEGGDIENFYFIGLSLEGQEVWLTYSEEGELLEEEADDGEGEEDGDDDEEFDDEDDDELLDDEEPEE